MTYDDVEFRPGPGLNLVLGPNGTGKSSIVSAICVGLGGNPRVLGRASKVRDYVKHGKDKAWIEVELVDKNLEPLLIRRTFKAKTATSSWRINGKPAKNQDVEELIASFNIQLDNLTQFLPQDKVAMFAAMGPVELLQSTQKAVLKPEVIEKQQQLIEKQQMFLQSSTTVNNYVQQISQLKKQNEGIERDVARYLERQKHLEKAEQLRVRKVFMEFSAMQIEGKKLLEHKKEAEKKLEEISSLMAPTMEQLKELQKKQKELDREEYKKNTEMKRIQTKIDQLTSRLEKASNGYNQKKSELEKVDNRESDREKQRQHYQRAIENYHQKLEKSSNFADKEEKEKAIKEKCNALQAERGEYDEQRSAIQDKQRSIEHDVQSVKYELQRLRQHDQRILTSVKQLNRNAYELYNWIIRNKDQFEMPNELFFVPLVVNIKNRLHATYFESSVAKNFQFGFVTPSVRDSDIIQEEIKRRSVQITVLRVDPRAQKQDQPRYSTEELNRFGLTAYLDQVVEAPAAVMRALCDVSSINTVLFSERANLQVEEIAKHLPNARTVFEPQMRHFISTSRYSNNTSIRSDPLRAARLFVGIDRARTHDMQQQMQVKNAEHAELTRQVEVVEASMHQIDVKLEEYRNQRREIYRYFQERKKWESQAKRYERELQKLSKEENVEAIKEGIHAKMREFNKERMRLVEHIRDNLTIMFKVDFSTDIYPILKSKLKDEENQVIQQQSQFTEEKQRAEASVAQYSASFDHVRAQLRTCKTRAIEKRNEYMEKQNIDDDAMRTLLNGLPDDLQTINDQIIIEETAANAIMENQNVIREYEKRKQDIIKMEKELEEFTKENSTMEAVIKQIEDEWATPLRKCVVELNQTFQQYTRNFGIAGEVHLKPHESDYAKWEIQIKVKFRDNEPLAVLSKSRQSGGERSVTTILYLLALQVINKSPFRVVDEINQGMDPINERKIFHQMLKSCTGKDVPQSFLITPKLLPDLVPHDANNITILFIFNGAFGLDADDVRTFNKKHKKGLKL